MVNQNSWNENNNNVLFAVDNNNNSITYLEGKI